MNFEITSTGVTEYVVKVVAFVSSLSLDSDVIDVPIRSGDLYYLHELLYVKVKKKFPDIPFLVSLPST